MNEAVNVCERRISANDVIDRLQEAGDTLRRLPGDRRPFSSMTAWPAYANDAKHAYGYTNTSVRPPSPSAEQIARMEEAFAWLALIPERQNAIRRIVAARSLLDDLTCKPRFSWRELGDMLGISHPTAKAWHAKGIDMIVRALR